MYRTAELAAAVGVHPNTVRRYEAWELIPRPKRQANGYRVFTDAHMEQLKLVRLAFQVEVLQNGLRKKMVQVVKVSATGDFDGALTLARAYLEQLGKERANAEAAAALVRELLAGAVTGHVHALRRKEVSQCLHISTDTLRSWEMNGLLNIRRKENGYRVYSDDDVRRIKIIRALRCANYSLEAILQMLCQLSQDPNVDIERALNTPKEDADVVAVCDRLVTSLLAAEHNAHNIIAMLAEMKGRG